MQIYFSQKAEQNLIDLSNYLLTEWGNKVKSEFIEKLVNKLDQIRKKPLSCPTSSIINGLHKCVITKQTTLFYRVQNNAIEVVYQAKPE